MESTTTTTTVKNMSKRNGKKRTRSLVALATLLGLGLFGVAPAAAASADNLRAARPTIADTSPASGSAADPTGSPAPSATTTDDATRYSAREKTAGQQADFRGGGAGIYIGGSALTVALIIVLIIILI